MGKEFEAQILDIDIKKMRKYLKENNGKRVHKNIKLVRAVFKRCNSNIKGFVRVRYEGKNTTMTVKIYNDKKFPDESEITIQEDFKTGRKFLQALNLKEKSYQETFREKWSLPIKSVHEITFDTWPGLPTYMEIDCTNEKTLNQVIKLLKVDKAKISYGSVGIKYDLYYGITEKAINEKIPTLTFNSIKKEIKPKKNITLFNQVVQDQKSLY